DERLLHLALTASRFRFLRWSVLIVVGLAVGLATSFNFTPIVVVLAILSLLQMANTMSFFFLVIRDLFHKRRSAFFVASIAMASYIFTILAFSLIYFSIYELSHETFNRKIDILTALYFSVTTMGTVGFG